MLLEIHDLELIRGARILQSGLGLSLESGEALWLRGANGSGKSTLIETIAGLRHFGKGEILWRGESIKGGMDRLHGELAYCGHKHGNAMMLSAREALGFYGALYGEKAQAIDEALKSVGLGARADIPVRYLSNGQAQRLALARLGLCGAALWLLDEPISALDADGAALVSDMIARHVAAGGAVIYTSHTPIKVNGAKEYQLHSHPQGPNAVNPNASRHEARANDDPYLSGDWSKLK